jgi:hypothetical protein
VNERKRVSVKEFAPREGAKETDEISEMER